MTTSWCSPFFFVTDAVAHQRAFFSMGVGPIVLKGVDCTGDEGSLLDCPINSLQDINCTHSRDAGVACSRMYIFYRVDTYYQSFPF